MPAFNARLLERCLALGDKDHYRKGGRETDLSARGPQSTAGAAGDTLRRGHVETHEGRQVRDRHRRGQAPVRGRPRACGARAGRRAARVRGRAARCLRGPHHDASARLRRQPHQQRRPVPADRAAVATGPGPGPTARSERRFPTRCANGSTGRRARSSPRGCARSGRPNARADGRTRWRRWPRSSRPPAASTAPAYAWPRPDTPPGPSPSPTTSPSTRRGYDLAFAGREDNA